MAKVIKVEVTAADQAYVQKDIAGDDFWIRTDVYFESQLPPGGGDDFSGCFINCVGATGCVFLYHDGANVEWWDSFGNNSVGGPIVTGQWYQVDYHITALNPSTEAIWIDDVDISPTFPAVDNTPDFTGVRFGYRFAGGYETAMVWYLRDISVGTSRGGSDLFLADLDGGGTLVTIFDDVQETTGNTITLIDDPTGGGGGPTTPGTSFDMLVLGSAG